MSTMVGCWEGCEGARRRRDSKWGACAGRISVRVWGSLGDAEEWVGGTGLRAGEDMPPSRPCPLRALLGRITRNISWHRYRAGRAQKRGGGTMDVLLEELTHCRPSTESVEGQYDANETAAVINRFLAELPPEKRQMFLRRYWFGDSVEEIAGRFAMRPGTVKSSLHRLRQRLRETLEKEGVAV